MRRWPRSASDVKLVLSSEGGDREGLSKRYIAQAVEDSLTRLQTDYIDLYQAHKDDPNTPLEETLAAFDGLIKAGKVRAIGASNHTGARLGEALRIGSARALPRYQTLQPPYNLYDRSDYETNLEPVCTADAIGVIPYFSLASGFLTGKHRSKEDLAKSKRGSLVENGPGAQIKGEYGLQVRTAIP